MRLQDIIMLLLSMLFCAGVSYYSYDSYAQSLNMVPADGSMTRQAVASDVKRVENVFSDELLLSQGSSAYDLFQARSPFKRKVVKVKKPKPVKKIELPKIKLPKRQFVVEDVPEEPEETYLFRGLVILGGREKYVIERERDKKTYFLNKGDKTNSFIVLETGKKEVVISDYDGNIKVLKSVK